MKNDQPYILYLGGIFSEEIMLASPAVSPAANRWQRGLLTAAMKAGESVAILGHLPERVWPNGSFGIGRQPAWPDETVGTSVPYCNLPLLRKWSLNRSYLKEFKNISRKRGRPKCIVSYNPYSYNVSTGLYAQRNLNVPWISIIADVPQNHVERSRHDQTLHDAAGRIFLSWGSYEDCLKTPKLHLDGGVEKIREISDAASPSPHVIFFSGAMNKWAGVELLIQAFSRISCKDVRLWICGKGAGDALTSAFRADQRITYFGCVSDEKLEELSGQSTIMVNPRDPGLSENRQNFPSKVLEYLSYCKPVVSTWTDGLDPEYRDVLAICKIATPDGIATKIEEVLGWDPSQFREYGLRVAAFLASKKTWEMQAQRFIEFLNGISTTQMN